MISSKPWRIIRTLMLSYFLSALLLLGMTFLLYKFRLDESQINIGIYGTYVLSCLTGGFLIGKAMRSKRLFWGLLIGILYFSLLFLLSALQEQRVPSDYSHLLKILGLCIGSSVAGSILS